jgi:uncharacterized small protein (DUF1192 family)
MLQQVEKTNSKNCPGELTMDKLEKFQLRRMSVSDLATRIAACCNEATKAENNRAEILNELHKTQDVYHERVK